MLKPEDFRSQTWKRLSSSLQLRLQELRESNDSPGLDEHQTSLIRGSIREVKRILALAEEVSASPAVTPSELAGDDEFIPGV